MQVLEARGTKNTISAIEVNANNNRQDDMVSAITDFSSGTSCVLHDRQNNSMVGGNAGSRFGRQRTIGMTHSGPRKI